MTAKGEKFFDVTFLVSKCQHIIVINVLIMTSKDIQKHHKREVTNPGPELSPLASNNEILLSRDNRILTFQGHPELNEAIQQSLIGGDDASYAMRPELGKVIKPVDAPHDGERVFGRIMEWVSEP